MTNPLASETQRTALALLDRAAEARAVTLRHVSTFLFGLAGAFVALKAIGLADGPDASLFVARCAAMPWWPVILMLAILLPSGIWVRRRSSALASPALSHLRANPSDPLAAAHVFVLVNQGYRSLEIAWTTASGKSIKEAVDARFEHDALAALRASGIPTTSP